MLKDTILGKIVDDKVLWVAARKAAQPLESFQHLLAPTDRDFVGALREKRTSFILECKKASPSKGLIRQDFDLDLIAGVYKNYASAISVLTDEKYFQGDFNYVTQVRKQVPVPVLCKDFVIDPYQIYLARLHQADAVLLMLSVLDDEQYRALYQVATSLNMGVLTEVSNDEELERAIALKSPVIGINNRNLRDLSISLSRTPELAAKIPADRVIISESGIYNHQQVKELSQYAHGFLVGSSLMAQDDVEMACRLLINGPNKVCGLTRPEDAAAVYQAGFTHGGLIFAPQSPRCVSIEQAQYVQRAAPLRYVGVFVDALIDQVLQTAQQLQLAAVQLHGSEDQAYVSELRQRLPTQVEIWKAVGVADNLPQLSWADADRILVDSKVAEQCGGTGRTFNWSLLAQTEKAKLILAGGLDADNIEQAATLGCYALDVNSGVESAPGIKDTSKIKAVAQKLMRAY